MKILISLAIAIMALSARAVDFSELVRQAKPAVVQLITYNAQRQVLATGSGFFISGYSSLADRVLVTNEHVVKGVLTML